MSRVGKYPVMVPIDVIVSISENEISVNGKFGISRLSISNDVEAILDGNHLFVRPTSKTKHSHMMWGTVRSLIFNMVKGVSEGFKTDLEINGVGYRAEVNGKILQLQLGFSHEIKYQIPDDIIINCEKSTNISIIGKDCQIVNQIASEIRAYRDPEPYKGKGIKFETEVILRKEGKKK
ncbi:MAG: 50S ribosomal protein L6 [Rhodospirillaceae bacterium]|jgi:large subunit ribosomal protein L6|nr:50S ribosomal protein L6 [Rhodospirillaceae bacterium]